MTEIRRYICALCVMLLLSLAGCAGGMLPITDDWNSDTVVFIPLDPEKTETDPETQPDSEEKTEAPTQPQADSTIAAPENPTTQQHSGEKTPGSGPHQPSPAETQVPQPTANVPAETVPEPTLYDISGYAVGTLEQQIADRINVLRSEQNLPALTLDGRLCAIASARAWELVTLWSHTRPNGLWFSTIGADYGYSGYIAAENLFHSGAEPAAQDVVQGWMNGSSQKDNLLAASHMTVGIGVYRSNGIVYIACLFSG